MRSSQLSLPEAELYNCACVGNLQQLALMSTFALTQDRARPGMAAAAINPFELSHVESSAKQSKH